MNRPQLTISDRFKDVAATVWGFLWTLGSRFGQARRRLEDIRTHTPDGKGVTKSWRGDYLPNRQTSCQKVVRTKTLDPDRDRQRWP